MTDRRILGADARPRIWINPNRDRRTASWSRHPTGKPRFATSPGAALDDALTEIGHVPAVIIWGEIDAARMAAAPDDP